jgi:hypothetical protein
MFESLDVWNETVQDAIYDEAIRNLEFEDLSGNDPVTLRGLGRLVKFLTHSTHDIRPLLTSAVRPQTHRQCDWLSSSEQVFGAESKQGKVVKTLLFGKRPVVLKSYDDMFETAKRDYVVGVVMANTLRQTCPFFVYTLGAWKTERRQCVLTDLVCGTVFADVAKTCSPTDFINIFAQILFALEVAQREFKFCHYDLHMKNIVIQNRKKPSICSLDLFDYTFSYCKMPIIIDLGMSHIESRGDSIGPEKLEKYGILKKMRVGYDAFTFLLFAYKELNDKKIVKKLLSFFGKDMNLSHHVECLEKFTDDKTPGMMLEWMMSEFPNALAMQKKDRESVSFFMPDAWCAARLLKKKMKLELFVADPTKEKSFARYQMMRHVNAHMGYFEKRDSNCVARIRFDFDLIKYPVADIEQAVTILFIVRYLNLDRKSKTYASWVRKLIASNEFKHYSISKKRRQDMKIPVFELNDR